MTETASWARRMLALFVDWIASMLVVMAFIGPGTYFETGNTAPGLYTLGVFVLEATVLTALAGGSFGKLATRLRVVRYDAARGVVGPPPDLLRSLLRSVMVALVIPPLVFKPDGRGLHDVVAGTATVPLVVAAS